MALELPYGIKRLDTSSNVDDMYGYYNSLQEALTNIVPGLRKGGRTVGIKQEDGSIVEYWWENDNDLSDAGLKLKSFNNSEVITLTLEDIEADSIEDVDLVDKLLAYKIANNIGNDNTKTYYYEILGEDTSNIPEIKIINKPIKEIIEDEYTILEEDNGYVLHFFSDVDVDITVPNITGFPRIEGKQLGEGQLIFNGVGSTVRTANLTLNKTDSIYSVFGLDKINSNEWVLFGNLELL